MAISSNIIDFLLSRTRRPSASYSGTNIHSLRRRDESVSDDVREYEETWNFVCHATMTSRPRVVALCDAVRYVVDARVPGDVVECGVWKGGSMMAAAKTLVDLGETDRRLWLFDTFSGMNQPTEKDIDYEGNIAQSLLEQSSRKQSDSIWCCAPLDEVQKNIESTGYLRERVEYVVGEVETTLLEEKNRPEKISILRLDTDWYESTRVALRELYPRLQTGGVLIIDDYGHWRGCREAVDEYFSRNQERPLFNRIDYTGRIAIKCPLQRHEVRCAG